MNRLFLLSLFLLTPESQSASIEKQKPDSHILGIKELEKDRLYVGKATKDFYLAMERVTDENAKVFKAYAEYQHEWIKKYSTNPLKYLPIAGGCTHFGKVMDSAKTLTDHNELWVAFASNKEIVKGMEYIPNKNIEMYVSVLIPSTAPVTAHMGISRTWEAALDFEKELIKNKPSGRKKHPDQSIHLHSFAAKVSMLRDPKKVFMFTTPVPAMQSILIDKMPVNSVFVGDSVYQKEVEREAQNTPWLDGDDLKSQELEQEQRSEFIAARRARIASKVALLKTHPPRIQEEHSFEDGWKITILNGNGSPLTTLERSKDEDYWAFTPVYRNGGLLSASVLVDLKALSDAKPLS